MSLCRFWWDDSDVYVYESTQGLECCGCSLHHTVTLSTEQEMGAHLEEHIAAGHTVLYYAFEGLGLPVPEGASRAVWTPEQRDAKIAEANQRARKEPGG